MPVINCQSKKKKKKKLDDQVERKNMGRVDPWPARLGPFKNKLILKWLLFKQDGTLAKAITRKNLTIKQKLEETKYRIH